MEKKQLRLVLKIVLGLITSAGAFLIYKQVSKNENHSGMQQVTSGEHSTSIQGNGNIGTNNGQVYQVDSGKIENNDNRKETSISVGNGNSGVNIATDNANIKNNSK